MYIIMTPIRSQSHYCNSELSFPIQNTLNISLDKANSWFKLKGMLPNTKKTKHLLIHSSETTMEIYIDNIKLEEAAGEKLLGVVIDSNLSWNLHIDYLIKKLNSRICLLKRAKVYLTFACRKMLYNALIKPILEYCCTVWGNSLSVKLPFNQLRHLATIRRFLSYQHFEILIHAFVTSRLDYCNSLLSGLPQNLLQKLQYVQNSAAVYYLSLGRLNILLRYLKNSTGCLLPSELNLRS